MGIWERSHCWQRYSWMMERQSGRLVLRASDKPDAGKEEDRAKDSINDDAFGISRPSCSVDKVDSRQNEAGCAQKGENNTQYPFFHNDFTGSGSNNVPVYAFCRATLHSMV